MGLSPRAGASAALPRPAKGRRGCTGIGRARHPATASDEPSRPPPARPGGVTRSGSRPGARASPACRAGRRDGPSSRRQSHPRPATVRTGFPVRDSACAHGPLPHLLRQLERGLEHVQQQARHRILLARARGLRRRPPHPAIWVRPGNGPTPRSSAPPRLLVLSMGPERCQCNGCSRAITCGNCSSACNHPARRATNSPRSRTMR